MDTRHLCETRWGWTRDRVQDAWSTLPDEELEAVAGDHDGLVSLLSDHCGYGWHEAADRLDEVVLGS